MTLVAFLWFSPLCVKIKNNDECENQPSRNPRQPVRPFNHQIYQTLKILYLGGCRVQLIVFLWLSLTECENQPSRNPRQPFLPRLPRARGAPWTAPTWACAQGGVFVIILKIFVIIVKVFIIIIKITSSSSWCPWIAPAWACAQGEEPGGPCHHCQSLCHHCHGPCNHC